MRATRQTGERKTLEQLVRRLVTHGDAAGFDASVFEDCSPGFCDDFHALRKAMRESDEGYESTDEANPSAARAAKLNWSGPANGAQIAKTSVGFYVIERVGNGQSFVLQDFDRDNHSFGTLEEAKIAAQDDFDRRIAECMAGTRNSGTSSGDVAVFAWAVRVNHGGAVYNAYTEGLPAFQVIGDATPLEEPVALVRQSDHLAALDAARNER